LSAVDDLQQELTAIHNDLIALTELMNKFGNSLSIDQSLVCKDEPLKPDTLLAYMGMIEQRVMELMLENGLL
jgi:hypothetical protein